MSAMNELDYFVALADRLKTDLRLIDQDLHPRSHTRELVERDTLYAAELGAALRSIRTAPTEVPDEGVETSHG